jgi:2-polyprenyl-3-methyl-5-hydroxy-6-metoxy-1,4-benzoquinol methylase
VTPGEVDNAARVANRFRSRFVRGYAASKIRTDPVYRAVADTLRGSTDPILDLGCGAGLMSLYLRELGLTMPITGIDHDERKIDEAILAARGLAGLSFIQGDARALEGLSGSFLLIDVLHYFHEEDRASILAAVKAAVPPDGLVVIRDGIDDGSWRYRATLAAEWFARLVRWLRAERLHFPRRDELLSAFEGFTCEATPLWGRTPFNNYLFVFRRSAEGTTKL